jgi:hypothetical protein
MSDDAYPLPGVSAMSTVGQWEEFFHPAFGSGIISGEGSEMAPSLDSSGRNVVIQPGGAIVRAFYKPVSTATYTPIPAASSQNRIDRLVLRLNRAASTAASFIVPTVITGTPAASPAIPAVTQTSGGLWDLPIAHWTSASNGSLSGLVDERMKISSPMAVMNSTAGTPVLDRAALLIQPDTGNLLVSSSPGGAWKTVWVDDDWQDGGNGLNGWTAAAHPANYFIYKFAAPGLVVAEFNLGAPGSTSGTNDGTQVLASPLPAAYRPTQDRVLPAHTDYQRILPNSPFSNNESSCLRVSAAGIVSCFGFATAATFAFGGGVYSVGSPY